MSGCACPCDCTLPVIDEGDRCGFCEDGNHVDYDPDAGWMFKLENPREDR